MKHMQNRLSARRARGLTLIELMISVAIGLVLMIAITSAYLGSSGATKIAEVQGRMNEDAQAALNILSQQIRMAGDNPRQPDYVNTQRSNPVFGAANVSQYAIRGCDGPFSDSALDINDNALCANTVNSNPDALAVVYEADRYNTVPTTPGGLPTDCSNGTLTDQTANIVTTNGVTTSTVAVTFRVADNRYYIAKKTATSAPNLVCRGKLSASTNEQPLVENIEDLQIVYGTAAGIGTPTIAGYLTATDISDLTTATLVTTPNDMPGHWSRVLSVKLCVVVRSESPVAIDAASAKYYKCFDNALSAAPDLRLRRAYYSTVILRNRVAPSN